VSKLDFPSIAHDYGTGLFNPYTSAPLGTNTYITSHTGVLRTGLQNYYHACTRIWKQNCKFSAYLNMHLEVKGLTLAI